MYRRGCPKPDRTDAALVADAVTASDDLAAMLDRKETILDEILAYVVDDRPLTYADVKALARRVRSGNTVRIMFERVPWGVFARVDERDGERIVFEVTEGAWIDVYAAEDLAQIYAAARELPVSRTDLPL
jgi:hypothetical protein